MSAPPLRIPVDLDMNALRQQGEQAAAFVDNVLKSIASNFDATNGQIASSTSSAFSQVGSSVAGVTVGLTGAAAATFGLLAALTKVSSEIADISRAAQFLNTTTDNFQALRFAGQTAGVSQGQATKDLESVARLLNDAQRNENSLSKLLDANNLKYKDRNGQLISIDDLLAKGAQLVANAGSYADKVQIAKMLGLTEQWVPVLEKGADEFKRIAGGAEAAGVIIDRETIAKAQLFDEAWRNSSSAITTQFKAAFVEVGSYVDDLVQQLGDAIERALDAKGAADGQAKFNAIADALQIVQRDAAGAAQDLDQVNRALDNYSKKTNVDVEIVAALERIRDKAQQARDEINRLGKAAYDGSGSPLPKARPANAGVPTNPTKIPAKDTGENQFDAAEDRIKKRTKEYEAETAAVGLNTEAKTRLKAIADLNAAADAAGITLTAKQKDEILKLADAEGRAAQVAADAAQKWKQHNDLIQFGGDQMISVMDGLRTKTLTAAQAVTQLENAFINAAEKALLLGTGPLAGLFGTAAPAGSGGTGGLLGQLFGGFREGGGPVSAGQAYVVGERRPELFVPSTSGSIVPSVGGGGGDQIVNVEIVNAAGAAVSTSKSRGADGGLNLKVMVDQVENALASRVAGGGSALNRGMEGRYGLNPVAGSVR